MVASKGGVSYDRAMSMTKAQLREMSFALAKAHGAEIDWEDLTIRPPQPVQQAVLRSVRGST